MGKRKRLVAEARKEANKSTYFAKLNSCPTSPRKMRQVADLVRGMEAYKALNVLKFNKQRLVAPGYKMIQKNNVIEYYNTRLVKLGFPWKCVGVTHEYWDGANTDTVSKEEMMISDIGDGGAKADKFDRDIRLLTEGLKEEPNNVRYVFYLAQSYKDCGKFKESIKLYKKRIQMGGWFEEVWYSYYMIGKCWLQLRQD